MTEARSRGKFALSTLHFLRGGLVGGLGAVFAILARQYFLGGHSAPNADILVGIVAVLLAAAMAMERAARWPVAARKPTLVMLDSVLTTVATALTALVGLLLVAQTHGVPGSSGFIPIVLALGLMGFGIWFAQAAAWRLHLHREGAGGAQDSAGWSADFAAMAKGIAGRNLINFSCVLGGYSLAVELLAASTLPDWCNGRPLSPAALILIVLVLSNAGSSEPPTLRRAGSMAVTGFAGGLAAILAAQVVAGCTGAADWLGWPRGGVELLSGGVVALSAYLIHESLMRERPHSDSDGGAEEHQDRP